MLNKSHSPNIIAVVSGRDSQAIRPPQLFQTLLLLEGSDRLTPGTGTFVGHEGGAARPAKEFTLEAADFGLDLVDVALWVGPQSILCIEDVLFKLTSEKH